MTMWFSLSKKSKLKRQGVVKVRLNFSSEKNAQVAAQEHRHLLRIILLHELENSKVSLTVPTYLILIIKGSHTTMNIFFVIIIN